MGTADGGEWDGRLKFKVQGLKAGGRKQEPALATNGKGGLKGTKRAGYLVASARGPLTRTTGESIPILAQTK
jgi:hypothetical protein